MSVCVTGHRIITLHVGFFVMNYCHNIRINLCSFVDSCSLHVLICSMWRNNRARAKTNNESQKAQCTQKRCLHLAVQWYLRPIHHIWAVAAETSCTNIRLPPPSLAPWIPLASSAHLLFPSLSPSSFLTHPIPTYCLSQGKKHNHLFICFLFLSCVVYFYW